MRDRERRERYLFIYERVVRGSERERGQSNNNWSTMTVAHYYIIIVMTMVITSVMQKKNEEKNHSVNFTLRVKAKMLERVGLQDPT